MELAKELGVTSKELMVAAEEMGHKGLRAMSPLDTTLANALRVKLGRGRELPAKPTPSAPGAAGAPPRKPGPKIGRSRPTGGPAPAPPRPARQPAPPFAPPRVTTVPRPAALAAPSRPAQPAASAPAPARPAAAVDAPPPPPAQAERELIRAPESATAREPPDATRRP